MSAQENNALIIRQENVATVISTVPSAYSDNIASHDRCIAVGNELLAEIQQHGMTPELDQKAADFIRKSAATVKVMMSRRSASTKLMDEIRSVFTQMEAEVNPTNAKSVAYELQKCRNDYAAQQYAVAEKARQEAAAQEEARIAVNKYRLDVKEDYRLLFNAKLEADSDILITKYKEVTLATYGDTFAEIKRWNCSLAPAWFMELRTTVPAPHGVSPDQVTAIRGEVLGEMIRAAQEQYRFEMESTRDRLLELLPSKKKELENIATGVGDAKKLVAQSDHQLECEIKTQLADNLKESYSKADNKGLLEAQGLFAQAAAQATVVVPHVKQKKIISLVNGRGILGVIALWWEHEGKSLTTAELEKMFKKQLTFCTKLANQPSPIFIDDPNVAYNTEVMAK